MLSFCMFKPHPLPVDMGNPRYRNRFTIRVRQYTLEVAVSIRLRSGFDKEQYSAPFLYAMNGSSVLIRVCFYGSIYIYTHICIYVYIYIAISDQYAQYGIPMAITVVNPTIVTFNRGLGNWIYNIKRPPAMVHGDAAGTRQLLKISGIPRYSKISGSIIQNFGEYHPKIRGLSSSKISGSIIIQNFGESCTL